MGKGTKIIFQKDNWLGSTIEDMISDSSYDNIFLIFDVLSEGGRWNLIGDFITNFLHISLQIENMFVPQFRILLCGLRLLMVFSLVRPTIIILWV